MKVALIHYRLELRGGLESRLKNYIQWFLDNGHEVEVICSKYDSSFPNYNRIKVHRLNLGICLKPYRKSKFSRLVKGFLAKNEYDLSISLGRTEGQDVILAPSNHLGYMKAHGKTKASADDKRQTKLDAQSYNSAKIVLAASEKVKDELIELYGVPSDKIHILHPPTNLNGFEFKPKSKTDKLTFLFVSTGHFNKGLPLLEKIFNQLDPNKFELKVAGHPKVEFHQPNIEFIGYIADKAKMNEAYHNADFFILPSTYEAFGQVVTEAWATGTPAIISKGVGAKELAKKHNTLIINDFDPRKWIKAIESIDPNDYKLDRSDVINLDLENHMQKMLAICL